MARSLTRGLVGFFSVVLLCAFMALVPAPFARAADPSPVDEILDIPSRVVKSVTGSPIGDTVMMMLRGQTWTAAQGTVATIPKPITAPAALSRGAGAPLAAGMLGWGIGSNGSLMAIGLITGSTYQEQFCAQAPWYQAVTGFINMGIQPDCKAYAPVANADQPFTFNLSHAGTTWELVGNSFKTTTEALENQFCARRSGTVPASNIRAWATTGTGGSSTYYAAMSSGQLSFWQTNCQAPSATGGFSNMLGMITRIEIRDVNLNPTDVGYVKASTTGQQANPTRAARCKITAGGKIYTAAGSSYKETEGIPRDATGLGCAQAFESFVSDPGKGPGLVPDEITVESVDAGGAVTEISKQLPPDHTPAEEETFKAGNGRGLVLEKVVNGSTRNCMTWEVNCADWWPATSSGTSPSTGSGFYRCTFAGSTIGLAECGAYRYTFDVQTATPTITNPQTGVQEPWTSAGEAPAPGTGTGTFPTTGTNPGAAVATATGGGGCTAGWSWNPVDWVLNPIRCAFIPSTAKVTAMQTAITGAWAGTMPGQLPGIVAAAIPENLDLSGCMGPHVYIPFSNINAGWVDIDWRPLAACEGAMADVATAARTIGAGALIYVTALGIIRRASATVNAPGLGGAG